MIATIKFEHNEAEWMGKILAGQNLLFSRTIPKLKPKSEKKKHVSDPLGIRAADRKWYEDECKDLWGSFPDDCTQQQFERCFLDCARAFILHEASRKRVIIHTTNYLEEIWTADFFERLITRLKNRTDPKKHGRGKDLEMILISAWERDGLCSMSQAERCKYVNVFFAKPFTPAAVQQRVYRLGLLFKQDETDANINWGDELRKAQTLRERLKLAKERGETADKGVIEFGLNKIESTFFSALDRLAKLEIPAAARGLDELGIQKLLVEKFGRLKNEMRTGFAKLAETPSKEKED